MLGMLFLLPLSSHMLLFHFLASQETISPLFHWPLGRMCVQFPWICEFSGFVLWSDKILSKVFPRLVLWLHRCSVLENISCVLARTVYSVVRLLHNQFSLSRSLIYATIFMRSVCTNPSRISTFMK